VRQRRDAHPRGNHLNEQQRIIDALQLRADTRRLQEVAPDIQTTALHRVNQQQLCGQVFRHNPRFQGQRMIRRQHQAHFKIKHRRIVQPAARQNIGRHHQIQLALLERGLRVKGHPGLEINLNVRPAGAEALERRRQPLNAAMTLNGDAQPGLLRLVTVLQGAGDLRQHLVCQLQQNLPLRGEAQRLTFTHKQTEAKALFQIAELVGQGGLGLVQGRRSARQ